MPYGFFPTGRVQGVWNLLMRMVNTLLSLVLLFDALFQTLPLVFLRTLCSFAFDVFQLPEGGVQQPVA